MKHHPIFQKVNIWHRELINRTVVAPTNIPVIANGGFHNLDKAETALKDNHADLIAIGKAALADPHWVIKTLNDLPIIPFHRDMLWPEATLSHTRKIIKELNLENN